jgi:hypothetical protein
MQYFNTLPKIIYTKNRKSTIYTNLMARVSLYPQLLKDPSLYYQYDIQEGDTPEIIAEKYYGDSYRYWIVMFVNQLMDPIWDWPMSQQELLSYLKKKYGSEYAFYSVVHEYQKILTQLDYGTNTTTVTKVAIDQNTYDSLVEETKYYSLPTGDLTITTTKAAVSVYDYENELNESKRNIKILNSLYVNELELQFKKLMSN